MKKVRGSTPHISNYYFLLTYLPRLERFKIICSEKLNKNGDVAQLVERLSVTPSVLRSKPTTKSCHEHRVCVIMHVIEGVDKFLVA